MSLRNSIPFQDGVLRISEPCFYGYQIEICFVKSFAAILSIWPCTIFAFLIRRLPYVFWALNAVN